jgi:hypothetical protein
MFDYLAPPLGIIQYRYFEINIRDLYSISRGYYNGILGYDTHPIKSPLIVPNAS